MLNSKALRADIDPTTYSHVIREKEVWRETQRLTCLLAGTGEDMTEVDLQSVAHQTLIRDLRCWAKQQHRIELLAAPWRVALNGDLQVELVVAHETQAVMLDLALR